MEGNAKFYTSSNLNEFLQVFNRHPAMRGVRYAVGCATAGSALYYMLRDSDKNADHEITAAQANPSKFAAINNFSSATAGVSTNSSAASNEWKRGFQERYQVLSTERSAASLQSYQWASTVHDSVRSLLLNSLTLNAAENNNLTEGGAVSLNCSNAP